MDTKELPLKNLLDRLIGAAEDSKACGYVTMPLDSYMKELQAHSSMITGNIERIALELERFGRLNPSDIPLVVATLKKIIDAY